MERKRLEKPILAYDLGRLATEARKDVEASEGWPADLRLRFKQVATDLEELAVKVTRLSDEAHAYREQHQPKAGGKKWSAKAKKRLRLSRAQKKAWALRKAGAPRYAPAPKPKLKAV